MLYKCDRCEVLFEREDLCHGRCPGCDNDVSAVYQTETEIMWRTWLTAEMDDKTGKVSFQLSTGTGETVDLDTVLQKADKARTDLELRRKIRRGEN